jgi:hypothetical protein
LTPVGFKSHLRHQKDAFLGYPKGLFYLAFTEAWEPFFEFHLRCAAY